jgi:hypothetical protein
VSPLIVEPVIEVAIKAIEHTDERERKRELTNSFFRE